MRLMNAKKKEKSIQKMNIKPISMKQLHMIKGGSRNAIVEETAEGI